MPTKEYGLNLMNHKWKITLSSYLVMLILLVIMSTAVSIHSSASNRNAYIIWMPSYVEYRFVAPELYDDVVNLLTENDYHIYVLHNPDELYSYLMNGVKKEDILINLHGSVFPLPSALQGKDGAIYLIKLISSDIKKGLHFINIAGLPFAIFSNKGRGYWISLDTQGIETFASDLNYSVSITSYQSISSSLSVAYITKDGEEMAIKDGLDLPSLVSATYSISANIRPYFTIYTTDTKGYFNNYVTVALFHIGNGFYGHVGIDWESYKVKVNAAVLLAMKIREVTNSTVYVIATGDADWYGIDMPSAKTYIEDLLNSLHVNYVIVNSSDTLNSLLNDKKAILINLHGEIFPIARTYLENESDYSDIAMRYIKDLAKFVKDGGSIINIAGRPFFALSNRSKNFWYVIGEKGLIAFISLASDYEACAVTYDNTAVGYIGAGITDFGRYLIKNYDDYEYLWSGVIAPYVIHTDMPLLFSLYATNDGQYAHATFLVGDGTFTFIGLDTHTPKETILTILRAVLNLIQHRELTVTVVESESRQALSNVYIEISTLNGARVTSYLTKEDGKYTTYLRGGEYTIRALHPSFSPKDITIYLLDLHENVTISLHPTILCISIYNAFTHNPISNANVTVYDMRGNKVAQGKTDDHGRVTFKVRDGEYVVRASAENYESQNVTVQVHGNTTLNIFLRNILTKVTITVVDSATGKPLPNVYLKVKSDDITNYKEGITNTKGVVVLTIPSHGPLIIEVYYHNTCVGTTVIESVLLPEEVSIRIPISLEAYYRHKYNEYRAKYENLAGMYSKLNKHYSDLLSEYNGLLNKLKEVNESYIVLRENYTVLLNNYTEVVNHLNNLTVLYNEVLKNNTQLMTKIDLLEERLEELNATYMKLLSDYEKLSSKYKNLLEEYNNLTKKYEALSTSYIKLKKNWPIVTAIAGIVGLIGGVMLGYTYMKRKGEYLVVPS